MFTKAQTLLSLATLASLVVPAIALPHPRWIRRQENAQTSLTLDPAVISPGLAQDGQGDNPDPGQVRSLTSTNNYINFCLTQNVPLTNGRQIAEGSCNQTPMGQIIPLDNSPRSKFVFPKNGDTSLIAGQPFTIQMKIAFMQTGAFTNPQTTYYAAPQQLNGANIVIGHSHVVLEELVSLQSAEPLDPTAFKFFKGLNNQDQAGILTADVTDGLNAGFFRLCSINTAANHQAVIVSNAQHGSLDDCVYFTVQAEGAVQEAEEEVEADATETSADAAEQPALTEEPAPEQSADAPVEQGGQDQQGQDQDAQNQDGQNQDNQNQEGQNQDGQDQDGQDQNDQEDQNGQGEGDNQGAQGQEQDGQAAAGEQNGEQQQQDDAQAGDVQEQGQQGRNQQGNNGDRNGQNDGRNDENRDRQRGFGGSN